MPGGPRIRANNVYGITTDNPLTIGATSMSSSGLTVLPDVTAAHAVIVLDPKRIFGEPEIVVVTSHAALSATATIIRGQYGTIARAHPINTTWAHIAINEDYTVIVTSLTRPTNPYTGQVIFETDTVLFKFWNGSSWNNLSTTGGGAATLAYAEILANQTGFGTTETAVTGLSVNVTVPTGRRLRITGFLLLFGASTTLRTDMKIKMDGVEIQREELFSTTTTADYGNIVRVISPAAGTRTFNITLQTSTGTTNVGQDTVRPGFILVEDITGSEAPFSNPSVPVGSLGQAFLTASQGSITTEVDLTGLSVNVSVAAGRTIKITGFVPAVSSTVSTDLARLCIREGATLMQLQNSGMGATFGDGLQVEWVGSPSAGSHTYKLTMQRLSGTGTLTTAGDPTFPAFIMVEDITPTPSAGTGAPSSTLGYAQITADQTTITTITPITGLSVNVVVPAGRRLKITAKAELLSTVSADKGSIFIRQDGTIIQGAATGLDVTPRNYSAVAEIVVTPSAGAHTYTVDAERTNGTGSMTVNASATSPAFLLVEDITGAVWPTATTITSGMLANETWTSFVPSLDQGVTTNIAKTTSYGRYYRLGKMVTFQFHLVLVGTGTASSTVSVSLPFAAVAYGGAGDRMIVGVGQIHDTSANTFYQGIAGFGNGTGATTIVFYPASANAGVGTQFLGLSVFTAALAVGDVVTGSIVYEAAA